MHLRVSVLLTTRHLTCSSRPGSMVKNINSRCCTSENMFIPAKLVQVIYCLKITIKDYASDLYHSGWIFFRTKCATNIEVKQFLFDIKISLKFSRVLLEFFVESPYDTFHTLHCLKYHVDSLLYCCIIGGRINKFTLSNNKVMLCIQSYIICILFC